MNKTYKAVWCGFTYEKNLTEWAYLIDSGRSYFEYRLKMGQDFQYALDCRAPAGHAERRCFLYPQQHDVSIC